MKGIVFFFLRGIEGIPERAKNCHLFRSRCVALRPSTSDSSPVVSHCLIDYGDARTRAEKRDARVGAVH